MKRIKVFNRIFIDAGYSFSFQRMYYEHVVMLFDQSHKKAQEFRAKIRAEYKSKGKEYDTQHMRNFHKVFDELERIIVDCTIGRIGTSASKYLTL